MWLDVDTEVLLYKFDLDFKKNNLINLFQKPWKDLFN